MLNYNEWLKENNYVNEQELKNNLFQDGFSYSYINKRISELRFMYEEYKAMYVIKKWFSNKNIDSETYNNNVNSLFNHLKSIDTSYTKRQFYNLQDKAILM